MAEGWARHFAGIEAHGKNPRAISIMQEAGIDISGQESTRVTPGMLEQADLVVTVCGHADEKSAGGIAAAGRTAIKQAIAVC